MTVTSKKLTLFLLMSTVNLIVWCVKVVDKSMCLGHVSRKDAEDVINIPEPDG